MPERFITGFVEGMGNQEDIVFSMTPPPTDLYELVGLKLKKKGVKKEVKRVKMGDVYYRTSELRNWMG